MDSNSDSSTTPLGMKLALLCVALWMGLFVLSTIGYGLPQQLDPDERYFIVSAINLLKPPLFDPGWYGHPASTLHLSLSIIYSLELIAIELLSHYDIIEFENNYLYSFFISGRIFILFIYIIIAFSIYISASSFLSKFASFVSFIFVLIFPGIVFYAGIIRADLILVCLVNLVFLFCVRIIVSGGKHDYALVGVAIGLATVTKYPGLLGVAPFLVAAAIDWRARGRSLSDLVARTAIAGAASIASAFIVAPFLFLNFDQVVADLMVQGKPRLGVTSEGFFSALWFYLTDAIPSITGMGPWLMGIVGLTWAVSKTQKVLPLLAFGAVFLIAMSFLTLQWERWMLPLAPVVALGVGTFSEFSLRALGTDRLRSYAIVVCVLVVGAAPSAIQSSELLIKRAKNADTRVFSEQWVYENLPCGSVILVETYAPQLQNGCHTILIPREGRLVEVDSTSTIGARPSAFFGSFGSNLKGANLTLFADSEIDFIIESSWRERFQRESRLYQEEIRVYDFISEYSTTLKTFFPDDQLLGPPITIYSFD